MYHEGSIRITSTCQTFSNNGRAMQLIFNPNPASFSICLPNPAPIVRLRADCRYYSKPIREGQSQRGMGIVCLVSP